jgi:phage shock protein E
MLASLRIFLSFGLVVAATLIASAQEHTKDSLDTVKKAIAEKKAVLIDVREKSEWDAGHLKDARLLPLSTLKEGTPKGLDTILPKDKVVYLHCGSGKRVLTATEILKKQGYEVRPLKEGYSSLLKSGFPKAAENK